MSYRGQLVTIECAANMRAIDVGRSRRALAKGDAFVESSFLDAMRNAANDAIDVGMPDGRVDIPKHQCWFNGNHVSEKTLALIAPMITGKLSGYFVGEDGSLYGGFVIESGCMVVCDISVALTPKVAT